MQMDPNLLHYDSSGFFPTHCSSRSESPFCSIRSIKEDEVNCMCMFVLINKRDAERRDKKEKMEEEIRRR